MTIAAALLVASSEWRLWISMSKAAPFTEKYVQTLVEGLVGAAERRSLPNPPIRSRAEAVTPSGQAASMDLTPFHDRLEKCETARQEAGTSDSQAGTACPTPAPAAREGGAQSPELSVVADVLMSALHASANSNRGKEQRSDKPVLLIEDGHASHKSTSRSASKSGSGRDA
jgi:hypothetical protein